MVKSNEDMRVYMAKRRTERRLFLIEMSGSECAKCGNSDIDALEFNHLDRSTKSFGLDKRGMDKSWDKILTEWKKCELLCQECHKDYTRTQHSSGQINSWNKDIHGEYLHGTARMYHEKKCRCERCRTAKRMYRAKLCRQEDVVA